MLIQNSQSLFYPDPSLAAVLQATLVVRDGINAGDNRPCSVQTNEWHQASWSKQSANDAEEKPKHCASTAGKARAGELHALLLAVKSHYPSLDDLARRFFCSARRLNEDFKGEYGLSVYEFISDLQLKRAHAAILSTSIPLKRLAEDLGYSHVNHFNAAFKRHFGYPPGSLRRNTNIAGSNQVAA